MRSELAVLAGAVVMLLPSTLLAQEEPCTAGDWFCEEQSTVPPVEEPPADVEASPEPTSAAPPADEEIVIERREGGQTKSRVIIVDRPEHAPKPPKRRKQREWGVNVRVEGALLGDDDDRHEDAGMGGLGFSFRYRPVPHFALDAGLDILGGVDWQGNRRQEDVLSLSGLLFFNPRDRLQVYSLFGINFTGAEVRQRESGDDDDDRFSEDEQHYRYFGGQLGLGLEWRVSRRTALGVDLIGFIRGRTDDEARYEPEFVDEDTGLTTNTSGGGLFRGGITFYW